MKKTSGAAGQGKRVRGKEVKKKDWQKLKEEENVNTIPPIQQNSMKNGYDENKGHGKEL